MTGESGTSAPELAKGNRRLAILLAMAMFVLVVDTSVMNVSIASVVHDLHTTVSGVQSAIALEALVSAAFILIGSKVGDLIGRKRAYVLGLLGYAMHQGTDRVAHAPRTPDQIGPPCCRRDERHRHQRLQRDRAEGAGCPGSVNKPMRWTRSSPTCRPPGRTSPSPVWPAQDAGTRIRHSSLAIPTVMRFRLEASRVLFAPSRPNRT